MDSQRLKGVRVMRGKVQADCAKAVGLCLTHYSLKENGKYPFNANEIVMLANFLHMTEDEANAIFFDGTLTKT